MRRVRMVMLAAMVGLMMVLVVVSAADYGRVGPASANESGPASTMIWGDPHIGVVADTSMGMQPALNALAGIWNNTDPAQLETSYSLAAYKDAAAFLGSTDDPDTFKNWLAELTATGGGDCEDAMFQALLAMARNAPDSKTMVLSNSAPMGGRSQLTFAMNWLIKRGVNVYPVIFDWCNGSELTKSSMVSLARLTGGMPRVVSPTHVGTATIATLNGMARLDHLLATNDQVNGVEIYDFDLDSTATTLGVDGEGCSPTWCLTCPRPAPARLPLGLQLEVIDPNDKVLKPSDPGVDAYQTTSGTSFRIDLTQLYTLTGPLTGTWQVRVTGSGDILLDVTGDSKVHFELLSDHVLRANKPQLMRVRLGVEPGAPQITETVQFSFVSFDGQTQANINLFDDGQHGDNQAGDGIYGGAVTPQKGIWYVKAEGQLVDGSPFQRTESTPIRAKRFNLTGPGNTNALPGMMVTHRFQLTNEDDVAKIYDITVGSSMGWAITETRPASLKALKLEPGETATLEVQVVVPAGASIGDVEETILVASEMNELGASQALSVETKVVDSLAVYLPVVINRKDNPPLPGPDVTQ